MSGEKMGNLNELNDILFEQLNTLRNADKSEAEREKTIAEAIRSVFSQQTNFKYNILVIDNHTTDDTTAIVK